MDGDVTDLKPDQAGLCVCSGALLRFNVQINLSGFSFGSDHSVSLLSPWQEKNKFFKPRKKTNMYSTGIKATGWFSDCVASVKLITSGSCFGGFGCIF